MTDRADRFADELDALTHGEPIPDTGDLARFAAEAHAVWSRDAGLPPGTPPRLTGTERRHLWEAIRREATVSRSSHEGNPVMSGTTLVAPVTTPRPSGWGATVARWQPVLSVAVMFALLFGLVGIAYTGLNRRDNDPSPTAAGLIAQATPTESLFTCLTYGPPAKTDQQLAEMSMSDWPLRHYTPVAPADPAIAADAVMLYQNWYECALYLSTMFSDSNPMSAEEYRLFDTMRGYTSVRMQYVNFLGNHPERNPSEIDAALVFRQDQVMAGGTLPLNRPLVTVSVPVLQQTYPSFSPGDLYLLSDGRYGAIIGSISTQQLQAYASGEPVSPSSPLAVGDWLTWIAFVEVDGRLFIDEYVSFCVSPLLETDGTPEVAGNYQYDGASPGTIGNCRSMLGE